MAKRTLLGLFVLLGLSLSASSMAASKNLALAFLLAQGWPNDLVALSGTPEGANALQNTINVIKKYREAGYDAHALVNIQIADKSKAILLLDRLVANQIPFVLEVMSSDCRDKKESLGLAKWGNAPAAPSTGLCLWPDARLEAGNTGVGYYINRYGSFFRGMRIMEPEWIFHGYKERKWALSWAADWIEKYVAAAHQNSIWVEYSSATWDCTGSCFGVSPEARQMVSETVATLARRYPGTIYPTFATNDGSNIERLDPASGYTPWKNLVSFWGARGIGLSDQSWMTGLRVNGVWVGEFDTPAWALVDYIRSAQSSGTNERPASFIQFETYWYMFTFSGGTGGPNEGKVSSKGRQIAEALGVYNLPY